MEPRPAMGTVRWMYRACSASIEAGSSTVRTLVWDYGAYNTYFSTYEGDGAAKVLRRTFATRRRSLPADRHRRPQLAREFDDNIRRKSRPPGGFPDGLPTIRLIEAICFSLVRRQKRI